MSAVATTVDEPKYLFRDNAQFTFERPISDEAREDSDEAIVAEFERNCIERQKRAGARTIRAQVCTLDAAEIVVVVVGGANDLTAVPERQENVRRAMRGAGFAAIGHARLIERLKVSDKKHVRFNNTAPTWTLEALESFVSSLTGVPLGPEQVRPAVAVGASPLERQNAAETAVGDAGEVDATPEGATVRAVVEAPPVAPEAPPSALNVMEDKPSTLNIALALAEKGHRVFPLGINAKTPAHSSNWQTLATRDPNRIRELWTCPVFGDPIDYNIGIPLERDEIVIDVDVRNGKRGVESLALWEAINDPLPPTYESRSWSGGRHLKFRHSTSGFPKHLGRDIDIKQYGGYVVAPGSIVQGARYELVHDVPAADAPAAVAALADGKPFAEPRKGKLKSLVELDLPENVDLAIKWLIDEAPEAIEGAGGDHTTVTVANEVGDRGISKALCLDLMAEHWNDTKAHGPWDVDDLAIKVANAYSYRRNPLGVKVVQATNEFGVAHVSDRPPPVDSKTTARPAIDGADDIPAQSANDIPAQSANDIPAQTTRRLTPPKLWDDATLVPDRPYLIDGVVNAGAMIVTYGDSNVGKSYVALDMAFCIASGRDWNGHKVKQGLVIYVAAEGGHGFGGRIEAYRRRYNARGLPFALIACPIDLQSRNADTQELIDWIRDTETRCGQGCVLVVIDTLARAMAGGDENTAVDMSKFVGHCDRIRAVTDAAANIIHHTGKDASKGARGSSALRAATDTEIEIRAGTVTVVKQRDMAPVPPMRFELEQVEIGKRTDGKVITACVVNWLEENEFEVRVSPLAEKFLELLRELMAARRDAAEEDGKPDKADLSIAWKDWKLSGFDSLKTSESGPPSESYLHKLRNELLTAGTVKQNKQNQWLTTETH